MEISEVRALGRGVPDFVFVEVQAEGLTGIGIAQTHGPAAAALLDGEIWPWRDRVIGRRLEDIEDIDCIWQEMYNQWTHPSGLAIHAMGAIDMALWDLLGKIRDVPVYQLLGGPVQQGVMAYASVSAYQVPPDYRGGPLFHKPPEVLVEECAEYVRQGFRAIKFGWGPHFDPEDQEKLAAMRAAIGPDIRLMLDFGNAGFLLPGWGLEGARQIARICEQYDIYFLEEPLRPHEVEGFAALTKSVDVKIATGEMLTTAWEFDRFIAQRAVDILQPDAGRIGLSQFVGAMQSAREEGILCIPHGPWSIVAVAAHVNALATIETGVMCEYPGPSLYEEEGRIFNPSVYLNTHEIVEHPLRLVDGILQLPERPGLGVGHFAPDAIARLESIHREEEQI